MLRDEDRADGIFSDDTDRTFVTVDIYMQTRHGQNSEMEIATAGGGPLNSKTDAELEYSIEPAANRGFKQDVRAIADAFCSLDSVADMVEMMSSVDVPETFFRSRLSRLNLLKTNVVLTVRCLKPRAGQHGPFFDDRRHGT